MRKIQDAFIAEKFNRCLYIYCKS